MIDVVNIFLHLDQYLGTAIGDFGVWVYLILFVIIFMETGLVIAPFLPGDSLIFLTGAFAAAGLLNGAWLLAVLITAAVLGDTVNYFIGHRIGMNALHKKIRYVKKEHVEKTYEFYEKHGGKTIVIARYIPIIRTFAPFVAGLANMKYSRFAFFNVVGGVSWIIVFLSLGYFFGNLAIVKENLSLVILAIIAVSLVPAAAGFIRYKRR